MKSVFLKSRLAILLLVMNLGVAVVALVVTTMLYVKIDRSHRQEAATRAGADRLQTQGAATRAGADRLQTQGATLPADAGRLLATGKKASWSPDGSRIVIGKPAGGLQLLDVDSNKTIELVGTGKDPTWSPDGRLIAYVYGPASDGSLSEEVWLITPTGEFPRKLVDGGFPTWSADSKTLYVHSRKEGSILAIAIDKPGAEPEVVLDKPGSWYPAISPDGTRIALGRQGALVIVDRQSRKPVLTWPTPGSRGLLPAWSPDGRQVAFGGFDGDPLGVWVLDVEAKTAVQVAQGPYTMPAWSPNGEKLAFDLRRRGVNEIWVIQSAEIQGPKLSVPEPVNLRIAVPARPTGPPTFPIKPSP